MPTAVTQDRRCECDSPRAGTWLEVRELRDLPGAATLPPAGIVPPLARRSHVRCTHRAIYTRSISRSRAPLQPSPFIPSHRTVLKSLSSSAPPVGLILRPELPQMHDGSPKANMRDIKEPSVVTIPRCAAFSNIGCGIRRPERSFTRHTNAKLAYVHTSTMKAPVWVCQLERWLGVLGNSRGICLATLCTPTGRNLPARAIINIPVPDHPSRRHSHGGD